MAIKFLGPLASGNSDNIVLGDLARVSVIQPKTGAWYYAHHHGAVAAAALTLSRLDLQPWPVFTKTSLTVTGFAINVTTAGAAGAVFRVGVYADDGSGYPGALVRDAGTIAMTATGAQSLILGTSLVLTPGLYWIGGAAQSVTASVSQSNGSGSWSGAIPFWLNSVTTTISATGASGQTHAYGQASVTGALPANFTTTPTVGIGSAARILFRT